MKRTGEESVGHWRGAASAVLAALLFALPLTLSGCNCAGGGLADPCDTHDDCQAGLFCHAKGTCQFPTGADGGPDAAADAGPIVGFDSSVPGTDMGVTPGCPCPPAEYCDHPDDLCGDVADGVCTGRPSGCPDIWMPVCGCDGQVWSNSCDAASAGVDVDADGACAPPPGMFDCGGQWCFSGVQYCWEILDDTGMPPAYSCEPLPMGCFGTDPVSCDCVLNVPCGDFCMQSGAGDITVVCPGG